MRLYAPFLMRSISVRSGVRIHALAFLVLLIVLSSASETSRAQASNGSMPQSLCAAPENRQFDFWVGEWDVYPKKSPEKMVAQSHIEKLYSGCAIRENWMPLVAGGDGGSL